MNRMSLADRIRAQRKKNTPAVEIAAEQAILRAVTKTIVNEDYNDSSTADTNKNITPTDDDVRRTSDAHPTFVGHTSDAHPTHDLQSSHIYPTSDIYTSDIHPTSIQHTSDIPPSPDTEINIDDPVWKLSDRQSIVLSYCIREKSRIFNRTKVAIETNIPIPTIKDCIKILVKERFISKPERFRNFGSKYKIYTEICDRFIKERCPSLTKKYGSPPSLKPHPVNIRPTSDIYTSDIHPTSIQHTSDKHPTLISSSSVLKETTTYIENQIAVNPELGFWRQKGLTPKQIAGWSKEFNLTTEHVIQALCYCRFDMVENNREEKESIRDVLSWFYKILERTGTYPRPANYKSHQKKEIEREKARLDEIKTQTEQLKKIREEAVRAELELEFEKMMAVPESHTYKRCYESIPGVIKSAHKRGNRSAFEAAMRKAFIDNNENNAIDNIK